MTVILLACLVFAGWLLVLYVNPFTACPRCHGQGHIVRGSGQRQRAVTCPACAGVKRRQRPGSRTVHQLARRVRIELARKARDRHAEHTTTYPED